MVADENLEEPEILEDLDIDWEAPIIIRDFRGANFFWLDNEVVDVFLPKIGATAFSLYAYLCRFVVNETQICWPAMSSMAAKLKVSKSTVSRSLKILQDHELIRIIKGARGGDKHEPNSYQLLSVKQPSSVGATRNSGPSSVGETWRPEPSSETISGPSSTASSKPSSKPSSATVLEQDLINKTNKEKHYRSTKKLSSDDPRELNLFKDDESKREKKKLTDSRHHPFKVKLTKFWTWLNDGRELYWDAAEAGQLARFLKKWPKMSLEEFHEALLNYSQSENIVDTRTPKQFLPRLHLYLNSPLNKYGNPSEEERKHT